MVDFEQKKDYLTWAATRLGQKFNPGDVTWLTSLSKTGSILGVVVFSRFTTGNCEISAVFDKPQALSKTLIQACACYAFAQQGVNRVTAFIAVGNERSLSLAQRLGFKVEGYARRWYPQGDAIILGLLREDFHFKDLHGLWLRPPST